MFFEQLLEEKLSQKILQIKPISGGDINDVYFINTKEKDFVLKVNSTSDYPKMFEKEKKGLEKISQTGANSPKVIEVFENLKHQFLLLEFINEGNIQKDFWRKFAEDLVKIHKTTNTSFGLAYDNYIGSLSQNNTPKKTWESFFVENRILPLVRRAFDKNLLRREHNELFEKVFIRLNEILPIEQPALVHGDLWSGNLMNNNGISPVFIDPAIYFGNREMDIAMTQMFGGFNNFFIQFYTEIFPLEKGWEERLKIYNLYPSLVHLILFGKSYLGGIERVIQQF